MLCDDAGIVPKSANALVAKPAAQMPTAIIETNEVFFIKEIFIKELER